MLKRNDISVLTLSVIFLAIGITYSKGSISAIGLALDVTGFILLWRFGLPSHLKPGGKVANVEWESRKDHTEENRYIFAKRIGDISVALIVSGFILQYLGTNR